MPNKGRFYKLDSCDFVVINLKKQKHHQTKSDNIECKKTCTAVVKLYDFFKFMNTSFKVLFPSLNSNPEALIWACGMFQVLDPVCHQLFEFYRSKESELKTFSRELIPVVIWTYLSALSTSGKKVCIIIVEVPIQAFLNMYW